MPFYFAYTNAEDTTFSSAHYVKDETIFSFKLVHTEGQFCTLDIEIQAPHIGILAPGRQQWAWFSWDDGDTVWPIFFGKVLGIPSDMSGQVITLKLIARPINFLAQKQALAETLKTRPNYDPLFYDAAHRDDPDSIIEGWASLYHIDRITHEVTISNLIQGDYLEVFQPEDAFYDSVKITLGQQPLTDVHAEMGVKWTQSGSGIIGTFSCAADTLTGDGLLSSWPKTGTDLSGGYKVVQASAIDYGNTANATTESWSKNYQNQEKTHADGDTISISESLSQPNFPVAQSIAVKRDEKRTIGDPDTGTAAAIELHHQDFLIALWSVACSMTLGFQAGMARTEKLVFDLRSDLQAVLSSPEQDGPNDQDIITLNGGDVGLPLLNVLNSLSVRSFEVKFGQVIRATDGKTFQVAVVPGVTGATDPTFPTTIGATTTDGAVTWAGVGGSVSDIPPTWSEVAHSQVQLGVICRPDYATNASAQPINNKAYQVCTTAGTTGNVPDPLPGQSGTKDPAFSDTYGVTTTDGSAVWTSLGLDGDGGYLQPAIGDATRGDYFTTDRGHWSIEYGLCMAGSALVLRSRAVRVEWECPWLRALTLSCRKEATLIDPRIPGGLATGKIIEYSLSGNGDTGAFTGSVVIGCAIGKAEITATNSAGTETYAVADYVDANFATTIGVVKVVSDIALGVGYSPPESSGRGLKFPITKDQVVIRQKLHIEEFDPTVSVTFVSQSTWGLSPAQAQAERTKEMEQSITNSLRQHPTWFELELLDLTQGGADVEYVINTSLLALDKGIDLTSSSW